jgi:Ca2+-binding RTX toxin-like protein
VIGSAFTRDGGAGTDTASYAHATAGVIASLATSSGTGGDANGDTFTGIEGLTGSDFDDILAGGAGAESLDGGAGNDTLVASAGADTLTGGAGVDTADYSSAASGVTVNLDGSSSSGDSAAGDTLTGVEW